MNKKTVKAWCLYFLGDSKEKEAICEWGVRGKYEIFATKKAAIKFIEQAKLEGSSIRKGVVILSCEICVELPIGIGNKRQ